MNKIENEKKEILDLYINSNSKILTRGKIKTSTLNKILEDINANCKTKKGD